MTIARINPSTWGAGDKLTSGQINSLDTNVTNALDKRSGQSDTLGSVVTCSGAGRVIQTVATGADANTTYQAGGGNTVINASAITAARSYTLGTTGAQSGDVITIINTGAFALSVFNQSSFKMAVLSGASTYEVATFVFIGASWSLLTPGIANQALSALNWNVSAAIGATASKVAWSDADQAWYAVQNASATAYRSLDFGRSWTAITLAAATSTPVDMSADPSGNIVIMNSNGSVIEGAFTSYGTNQTWTNRAAVVGTFDAGGAVVYDPSASLWVTLGARLVNGTLVYTSPDRATWTSRTIPAGWTVAATYTTPQVGASNGLVVAAVIDTSFTFRTMRSSNGGVTWANDQATTLATIGTLGFVTSPVWSDIDGLWYLAVRGTSSRVAVYSSPDAITWTVAATLSAQGANFVGMHVQGSLVVGVNADGRVFCSPNQGISWFRCGNCGVTPSLMKGGGNGILALAGANAVTSTRFGMPATAA